MEASRLPKIIIEYKPKGKSALEDLERDRPKCAAATGIRVYSLKKMKKEFLSEF
jgi:hypothetical protein